MRKRAKQARRNDNLLARLLGARGCLCGIIRRRPAASGIKTPRSGEPCSACSNSIGRAYSCNVSNSENEKRGLAAPWQGKGVVKLSCIIIGSRWRPSHRRCRRWRRGLLLKLPRAHLYAHLRAAACYLDAFRRW